MIAEVYDAFVSARADEAKARRAAEVLTEFDSRFPDIDKRFDHVERRIDLLGVKLRAEISVLKREMDGKFSLLYWMFGVLVAGVATLTVLSFFHM
jgi:hypothetical protein